MLHELFYSQQFNPDNFFLMAGPCVIENEEMPFRIAEILIKITQKYQVPFVFKASYRKANRSKYDSFTGIGDEKGLRVLNEIRKHYSIPVVTDIHETHEAEMAGEYVDILQIPAFLCRQTDLLLAAGKTGKYVNVKKGQFVAPESMVHVVEKIHQAGNQKIILTERGTTFGYQDLIVDFRSIPIMQQNKVPVVMDVTHSLQQPNQLGGVTGGRPDLIETIAKAAIAVGVDGLFIETHPEPDQAKSDGANMLHLDFMDELIAKLVKLRKAVK